MATKKKAAPKKAAGSAVLEAEPPSAPEIGDHKGKLEIVRSINGAPSAFDLEPEEPKDEKVRTAIFSTFDARAVGSGFPPGEIILDVQLEDGQEHRRFSTWAGDGSFDVSLSGMIIGPGVWLIRPETAVGSTVSVGHEVELEVT